MTYTIFHLGAYISLGTAVLAIDGLMARTHVTIRIGAAFLAIAGAAGGIIAGSIPESPTWEHFTGRELGPWEFEWFRYSTWAGIEHTAFWIGVTIPLISVLFFRVAPLMESRKSAK